MYYELNFGHPGHLWSVSKSPLVQETTGMSMMTGKDTGETISGERPKDWDIWF